MTALAMIIGMLPMALGLGEGGEQNAPLGRAVIGGLLFATIATLFFVPVVFSLVHARDGRRARRAAVARALDRRTAMSPDPARANRAGRDAVVAAQAAASPRSSSRSSRS